MSRMMSATLLATAIVLFGCAGDTTPLDEAFAQDPAVLRAVGRDGPVDLGDVVDELADGSAALLSGEADERDAAATGTLFGVVSAVIDRDSVDAGEAEGFVDTLRDRLGQDGTSAGEPVDAPEEFRRLYRDLAERVDPALLADLLSGFNLGRSWAESSSS